MYPVPSQTVYLSIKKQTKRENIQRFFPNRMTKMKCSSLLQSSEFRLHQICKERGAFDIIISQKKEFVISCCLVLIQNEYDLQYLLEVVELSCIPTPAMKILRLY